MNRETNAKIKVKENETLSGSILPTTKKYKPTYKKHFLSYQPVVLNLWGMNDQTEEPLLQNLTHYIQMLTYFTNHNHLQIVLLTKTTNI